MSFTDKGWAGKTPPEDEYVCVTMGVFVVDGIMANVTYLSNELESKPYQDGLAIITSLTGKTKLN